MPSMRPKRMASTRNRLPGRPARSAAGVMQSLLDPPQPAEPLGLELAGGRRDRHPRLRRDLPGRLPPASVQQHPTDPMPRGLAPQPVRLAGAILEPALAVRRMASQPLVRGLASHSGGLGRLRDPPAELSNPMDQEPAKSLLRPLS
jgi:hypothetical protein